MLRPKFDGTLLWFLVVSVWTLSSGVYALDNGLALTPQMGWNTWNHFGCNINEDTILSAANAIIDTKLNELGYECES